MRIVSVFCSRCKQQIAEGASVMTVSIPFGQLAAKLPDPVDICRPCADSFLGWLNLGVAESPGNEAGDA